jgi:hypothetical protein
MVRHDERSYIIDAYQILLIAGVFHTFASRSSTPSVARTPRPLVLSAPHQSGPATLCSPLLIYNTSSCRIHLP